MDKSPRVNKCEKVVVVRSLNQNTCSAAMRKFDVCLNAIRPPNEGDWHDLAMLLPAYAHPAHGMLGSQSVASR